MSGTCLDFGWRSGMKQNDPRYRAGAGSPAPRFSVWPTPNRTARIPGPVFGERPASRSCRKPNTEALFSHRSIRAKNSRMQTKQIKEDIETTRAILTPRKPSPRLPDTQDRRRDWPGRLSLPPRRREACLTRRAMLAALREAELSEWMASGGDFLDHTYQPVL